jgi:Protein of unknown function (DUF3489)
MACGVKELDCSARLRDLYRDRGICRGKENPNVLTFTLDRNNHITALTTTPHAQVNPEAARFSGARDLDRLAKLWSGPRLVEIWNALPGQKPVKKFTNRKAAVSRIWAAAQSLAPDRTGLCLVPQKAKSGKRASRIQNPATAGRRGKTGRVLELLQRPGGATLKQLVTATQWQAHSVRGFLSGALKKKMGLKIVSTKRPAGDRSYSIQA